MFRLNKTLLAVAFSIVFSFFLFLGWPFKLTDCQHEHRNGQNLVQILNCFDQLPLNEIGYYVQFLMAEKPSQFDQVCRNIYQIGPDDSELDQEAYRICDDHGNIKKNNCLIYSFG